MNTHEHSPSILQSIMKYWPILAFAASLIITWARFDSTLSSLTNRTTNLETKVVNLDGGQNQIMTQLSQIQTDLSWIKGKYK